MEGMKAVLQAVLVPAPRQLGIGSCVLATVNGAATEPTRIQYYD